MAIYRLPDGIEVTLSDNGGVAGAGVWVEHPIYGPIAVERDKLTEVPSEPEDRPEASGSPAFGTRLRDAFTWPQTCPNVSFYGRRCELPPHGWDRSCMFTPDREDEYDLADGSTLKDLLEALTAGGRVAVSAAMRWNEYRLHSQAVEAGRLFGMDHTVMRGRWLAVESAKGQREILLGYLGRRVAEGVPSDAGSGAQREQPIQDEEAVAEGEGEP